MKTVPLMAGQPVKPRLCVGLGLEEVVEDDVVDELMVEVGAADCDDDESKVDDPKLEAY